MFRIIISTIYQFWSPTLTTFWQSVFVPLFSMVYSPPNYKYISLWSIKLLFVSQGQGLRKFQISLGPSVSGGPNFLFARGGRVSPFASIKPSVTNHINSRIVMVKLSISSVYDNFCHSYLGIFHMRIFFMFKCTFRLAKKWLLLFDNNSMGV